MKLDVLMLVAGFAAVKGSVVMAAEALLHIRLFHFIPRPNVRLVGLVAERAVLNALLRLIFVWPVLVRVHGCYLRLLRIESLEEGRFCRKLLIWAMTHETLCLGRVLLGRFGISDAG